MVVASADLRSTSAAVGAQATLVLGAMGAGASPRSSPKVARVYRPAQVSGATGTIRGATAATRGSAKCLANAAIQPCSGTQSLSIKATSSVPAASLPVL